MPDNARTTVLITRPLAQGEAFARDVRERFGDRVRVVVAPVLSIGWRVPDRVPQDEAVLFTSANGIMGLSRVWTGHASVWCVGSRTAGLAAEAGHGVQGWATNADDLVARLSLLSPDAFYHARGTHSRGNLAQRLIAAGHSVTEGVVYDQEAIPLSQTAFDALREGNRVVLPVFSPRSAKSLAAQLEDCRTHVVPVCLSAAVRDALPERLAQVAIVVDFPEATAMIDAIGAAISTPGAA